ncbi:NAD(P)H-dependent glycerol-3-phosphate dehydrogenase [Mycoplasma sp. P36-A1]|uniref:NAD(P)H-dependent glycerol-3-phosphate dehydrogenase n=1 Tax=Mycoplasma sp. P36-A1 TaxID=3252900 RepID=UPI003C2BAC63
MKVSIIGSGSWGTALAQVLADNKHDAIIYGIDKEEIKDINSGYNHKFFDDLKINSNIKATTSLEEALKDTDVILMVVPTKVTKSVLKEISQYLNPNKKVYIVNASKGFDPQTNDRMSETIRKTISEEYRHEVCSIIGPSHAEEVIQRMYTAICSVSLDTDVAEAIQLLFSNDYIRLYTLTDEVGAEYGVAFKNVLALCSGVITGIGLGDNTRAALLTRGLHEMINYGVAKGGKVETYLGLTGIGDLIVTATSVHSRNYQAGLKIGQQHSSKAVVEDASTTIEGVRTCKVIYQDSQSMGLELPIINECYAVLYEDEDPEQAINNLMSRKLKAER